MRPGPAQPTQAVIHAQAKQSPRQAEVATINGLAEVVTLHDRKPAVSSDDGGRGRAATGTWSME
jgi:hypothetical protein